MNESHVHAQAVLLAVAIAAKRCIEEDRCAEPNPSHTRTTRLHSTSLDFAERTGGRSFVGMRLSATIHWYSLRLIIVFVFAIYSCACSFSILFVVLFWLLGTQMTVQEWVGKKVRSTGIVEQQVWYSTGPCMSDWLNGRMNEEYGCFEERKRKKIRKKEWLNKKYACCLTVSQSLSIAGRCGRQEKWTQEMDSVPGSARQSAFLWYAPLLWILSLSYFVLIYLFSSRENIFIDSPIFFISFWSHVIVNLMDFALDLESDELNATNPVNRLQEGVSLLAEIGNNRRLCRALTLVCNKFDLFSYDCLLVSYFIFIYSMYYLLFI